MKWKLSIKFITLNGWSPAETVHVPFVFLVMPGGPESCYTLSSSRPEIRQAMKIYPVQGGFEKYVLLRVKRGLHEQFS